MSVRLPGIGSKAIALVATLFVLVAASVVIDRLGAPPALTRTLVIIFSAVSIGMAGALTRTVRGSTYLSAGQRLGSVRGTSTALIAGTGMLFLAPAAGLSGPTLIAALATGLLLYAVLYAAPLQRAGVASLGAFAMARFGSRLLSFVVGLIVLALTTVLAIMAGALAVSALKPATGLSEPVLRAGVAGLALLMVLPGGYASLAAASVIIVLLALSGVASSFAVISVRFDDLFAQATQTALREALATAATPEILAGGFAFAGMLAALGTAPACRSAGIARQSGAAALLALLGLALALATLGHIGAMLDREAIDSLRFSATLGLPVPFAVLLGLLPGLFLTGLLAALARGAASALVQDGLGALGRNRAAMSSRLALHRIAAIVIVGIASGGYLPLPEPQPVWVRAALTAGAMLPLALLWPALFQSADWRVACTGALAAIALAILTGLGIIALPIWQAGAIFLGALAVALLVFRSRSAGDGRAAQVLAGRAATPLLQVQDA